MLRLRDMCGSRTPTDLLRSDILQHGGFPTLIPVKSRGVHVMQENTVVHFVRSVAIICTLGMSKENFTNSKVSMNAETLTNFIIILKVEIFENLLRDSSSQGFGFAFYGDYYNVRPLSTHGIHILKLIFIDNNVVATKTQNKKTARLVRFVSLKGPETEHKLFEAKICRIKITENASKSEY
ncbi:hypothetical protein WN51_14132 [Melipona quadrifasciata]|uniref:Uncharacterized protein n=1 Tax=Melipona quadrifasciata TaxID=166423 RepID=A0A0N0U554_9HYME|nr:hypothetical protein WN51_14132 [Melipona quadrifasciata]